MKFKAEDFYPLSGLNERYLDIDVNEAADIANAKLEEWLAEAPVVIGSPTVDVWREGGCKPEYETHRARLVCIEPIVQESEERKLLREVLHLYADKYADCELTMDKVRRLLEKK